MSHPPGFTTSPSPAKTTDKKAPKELASSKRVILALSDGWSLVTKKHARHTPSPSSCAATTSAPKLVSRPDVSPAFVQKRMALIHRCRAEYAASPVAVAVRTRLRQALLDSGRECDVAVLVGLGRLDTTDADIRPVWQLVFFLDAVGVLGAERDNADGSRPPIKMYAQDPIFGPLETEMLAAFDVEIVADPAAWDLVSRSALLFAPFVHWDTVLRRALAARDPLLYIGANLSEIVELLERSDGIASQDPAAAKACLQLATLFIAHRRAWRVPTFAPGWLALQGLTMYWPDPEKLMDEGAERKKVRAERVLEERGHVAADSVGMG